MDTTKLRIFEVKPFAVHDGDGIRTTVFFRGCPLRCRWCHNPEGLGGNAELGFFAAKCVSCGACVGACPRGAHAIRDGVHTFDRAKCAGCGKCAETCPVGAMRLYGRDVTVAELLPELLADRSFYETSGGGVTLSGGECLLQSDGCRALLAALKKEGIRTAVDTAGDVDRAAIDAVLPYTDTFLYDVKAVDEDVHRKCTGRGNRQILDNLRYLCEKGARVEVRVPYVPGWNSGEMPAIASLLASLFGIVKVRVLAYHDFARSKYAALGMHDTLPERVPTEEELTTARDLFRHAGLAVAE